MFELWLNGLRDEQSPFIHNSKTTDFLQVCCDISSKLGPSIAGQFVTDLLEKHEALADYMRVLDWKFTLNLGENSIELDYSVQK